jgi:rubredoxin
MSETKLEKFEGFIHTELTVECTTPKCKTIAGSWDIDDYYFIEELVEKGWRATSQNCYCPSCAKKKLKQK